MHVHISFDKSNENDQMIGILKINLVSGGLSIDLVENIYDYTMEEFTKIRNIVKAGETTNEEFRCSFRINMLQMLTVSANGRTIGICGKDRIIRFIDSCICAISEFY